MKERLRIARSHAGFIFAHHPRTLRETPHRHDELELNLATAGRACYLIAGARFEIGPGTLLWLFPAQPHMLVRESGDFAMWVAVFRPSLVQQLCRQEDTRWLRRHLPAGVCLRQLDFASRSALDAACGQLAAQSWHADLFNAGLGHLLMQAWEAFTEAEDSPSGADLHPAVNKATLLLRDSEAGDSLTALSRQAGLSPAQLRRLFRDQLGMTMSEFRNRQRLARFVQLYGTGRRLDLLQAADAAGFGSYAQFYRVLRAQMGCSPAEYKRRVRPAPPAAGRLLH